MTGLIQRLGTWLERRHREQTLALLDRMADALRRLETPRPVSRRRRACMSRCSQRATAQV